MKRVTIQDIAKELEMSRNTVAKAFNNGAIAPETKKIVIEKAWEMGYVKLTEEHLAFIHKGSVYQKNGTILVLLKRQESDLWSRILEGVHESGKENGARIQIYIVDEDNQTGEEVLQQLEKDVIGIIFLCIFSIQFVREIARAGLPMTFFNTPVNAQEYIELGDVYSMESFYSMNRITTYCIKKKHCTTFGYIGYAEGSRVVQARYLGFLGVCKQYGIEINGNHMVTRPKRGEYFSYELIKEILEQMNPLPDCIVCENDSIAMNVAMILLQKDPMLARTITLTGYDDSIPEDFFKKDILTVRINTLELGKRLVESVLSHVRNPQRDKAFVTLTTYPILR